MINSAHLEIPFFPLLLYVIIQFIVFPPIRQVDANADKYNQPAYGVKHEFYDIAQTRLGQLNENTLLKCHEANVKWYRRSLRSEDAQLGDEEEILPTLMVDWKWASKKKKENTRDTNPQMFKFELNNKGLIIHDTQWHDLGQYYCTTGTGTNEEVKKLYLVYQRPIILFVDTEAKIKDRGLDKAITDPSKFVNRLEDPKGETPMPIELGQTGVIKAMWRAYPFVDKQSTAPEGFEHSGYKWDDGDVCRWLKVKVDVKDREKKKIAFTGVMDKDVELMGKNDRYTYKFDPQKGEATWTIKSAKDDDEGNRTLNVQNSRGSSHSFYFVRPKDNMAYLMPLIVLVVEVVLTIVLCVVFYFLEKRRERKVEESPSTIQLENPKKAFPAEKTSKTSNPTPLPTSTKENQEQGQQQQQKQRHQSSTATAASATKTPTRKGANVSEGN